MLRMRGEDEDGGSWGCEDNEVEGTGVPFENRTKDDSNG